MGALGFAPVSVVRIAVSVASRTWDALLAQALLVPGGVPIAAVAEWI